MYTPRMSFLCFVLHSPCKEDIEQATYLLSPNFPVDEGKIACHIPHQGFGSLRTQCVETELGFLSVI